MTESRFKRLERLFDEALSLDDAERDTFVHECKQKDADIGAALEDLLRHASDETSYSDALGSVAASALGDAVGQGVAPGSRIGGIEIVERIGTGGMGEVYLGRQSEPLERDVAVKLVRAGVRVEQVLARFEAERQVLARMNHPNIAQVYDAGTDASGQPYFVMEYIRGEPVTDYVMSQGLNLDDRLELFAKICAGVQHAHQRGVIHRDIKPSNVLVNDEGQPKIIDFGIAKLVEDGQDAGLTQMDQALGTPQYMSPEQAAFRNDEIDTRSDVYALGALLFELLAGKPPLDTHDKSPLEVRQAISESVLPRASDCASADLPYSAERLSGDLDLIIARALAREKDRRYGSPAELAADIVRFQSHEPVIAAPDELSYRLKKFTRRHRTGVAVAAVAFVTIVAGVAGTLVSLSRALEAERAAAQSAEIANETVNFIEEIFSAADSTKQRGAQITAKEVVDQGVTQMRLNEDLPWPTRARLLQAMGRVYFGLGLFTDAIPLLEESIALYESNADMSADPDANYFSSQVALSRALTTIGETERAAELIDTVIARQVAAFGPDHAGLIDARLIKQLSFTGKGDAEAARSHFAITQALLDANDASPVDRAVLLNAMSAVYIEESNYDEAILLGREAVDLITGSLDPSHPDALTTRANLAWHLSAGRQYAEAEEEFLSMIDDQERVFGEDHFSLGITLFNLGVLQRNIGRYSDARDNYARAGDIWGDQLGPDHAYVLVTISNVAQLHYDLGEYEQSEAMYLDLIERERRLLAANDPERAFAMNNLGMVYHATGDLEAAESWLTEAQTLRIEGLGEGHAFVLDGYVNLGRVARDKGDIAAAKASLEKAIDMATERFDANDTVVARASFVLGELLIDEGQAVDALAYLSQSVRAFEEKYPDGYWGTAAARSAYGEALMQTGDVEAAEREMRRGLEELLAGEDRDSTYTRDAVDRLIRLYTLTADADSKAEMEALRDALQREFETAT